MNVRVYKILGKELVIQDKDLISPKLGDIRGINPPPFW